ncbi:hypothetical protein [Gardnerella vaginalis]|uniref:hypothetical protein n=1 Tax=Gardnerella vaginalis TaxID=2702 RepID=UPI0039F0B0F0
MISKELDEALARLKKAKEKVSQIDKEYDHAKAECKLLTQLGAKVNKARCKLDEALEKWHEADNQFNNEHDQLIAAQIDARNEWNDAHARVKEIIRKLTEA